MNHWDNVFCNNEHFLILYFSSLFCRSVNGVGWIGWVTVAHHCPANRATIHWGTIQMKFASGPSSVDLFATLSNMSTPLLGIRKCLSERTTLVVGTTVPSVDWTTVSCGATCPVCAKVLMGNWIIPNMSTPLLGIHKCRSERTTLVLRINWIVTLLDGMSVPYSSLWS